MECRLLVELQPRANAFKFRRPGLEDVYGWVVVS